MFSSTRRKRFGAWMAILAMLAASLAPTVSHALSAQRGAPSGWTDICTVAGAKTLKSVGLGQPQNSAPGEGGVAANLDCAYCLLHSGNLAPPPSPAVAVPAMSAAVHMPALFYRSPRPLFAWATAHPRAPPASA